MTDEEKARLAALKEVSDIRRRSQAWVEAGRDFGVAEAIAHIEELMKLCNAIAADREALLLEMERRAEEQVAEAAVRDAGWRRTSSDTVFASPFGTIRRCRYCGVLVSGGPTSCLYCVDRQIASKPSKDPDQPGMHGEGTYP